MPASSVRLFISSSNALFGVFGIFRVSPTPNVPAASSLENKHSNKRTMRQPSTSLPDASGC